MSEDIQSHPGDCCKGNLALAWWRTACWRPMARLPGSVSCRELPPGWIGSSITTPVSSHIHLVALGRRGIATAMGGGHAIYHGTPILRIVRSESGAARPHCTPGVSAATSPDSRTAAVFHSAVY